MRPPSFRLFRPPSVPRGKGAFASVREGALLSDFSRPVIGVLSLERREVDRHYVRYDKDRAQAP